MASDEGTRKPFDVADLHAMEPFGQFNHWFEEILQGGDFVEAHGMVLATATKEGIPSARMVALRKCDKEGLVFCTSMDSRKAKELKENPHCSLVFMWRRQQKLVRIEGTVKPIPATEVETFLQEFPRQCQINIHIGTQSTVIPGREYLDKKNSELTLKYSDETKPIPIPESWGGFRVMPTVFEFMKEGNDNWLADRLVFRRPRKGETIDKTVTMEVEDGWLLERLLP